jgi:hypothetical protein
VRTDGLHKGYAQISVEWFGYNDYGSTPWLGHARCPLPSPWTTAWTKLSVTAVAPTNAAYAEIHLAVVDDPGTVWFDDVTFS